MVHRVTMQLQDRMIEVSSMLPSLPKLSGGVVEVLPSQGSLNIQGNGETTTQVSTTNGDKFSKLEAGKRWWMRKRWWYAEEMVEHRTKMAEKWGNGCGRPDVRARGRMSGPGRMSGARAGCPGCPSQEKFLATGGVWGKIRWIFRMKFREKWRKS